MSKPKNTKQRPTSKGSSKRAQSIFILVIVALFALSTVGVGIWSLIQARSEANSPSAAEVQAEEAQEIKAKTPEAFVVDGDVTELKIEDIQVGDGDQEVTIDSTLEVYYHGSLAQTGEIFDSSYNRGSSATFPLSNVISGWQEGLIGMKEGGVRRLVIPADKAYGDSGTTLSSTGDLIKDRVDTGKDIDPNKAVDSDGDGQIDYIPEDADLVFHVELIKIQ